MYIKKKKTCCRSCTLNLGLLFSLSLFSYSETAYFLFPAASNTTATFMQSTVPSHPAGAVPEHLNSKMRQY